MKVIEFVIITAFLFFGLLLGQLQAFNQNHKLEIPISKIWKP